MAVAQTALDAGTLLQSDLLMAHVGLAQAQQAVIAVFALRDATYGRLGLAIGADGPARPTSPSPETPALPTETEDNLVARATADRPELASLRAQLAAAQANVTVTSFTRYPQINALGSYTHTEGQGVFAEKNAGFVGASLDWTLWSWGQKTAAVHAAQAQVDQVRSQLEGATAAIRLDVRTRLASIGAAVAAYEVATRILDQAEQNVHILEIRQAAGTATLSDLLDAQTAMVRVQSSQANALYDARRAEVALAHAVGAEP